GRREKRAGAGDLVAGKSDAFDPERLVAAVDGEVAGEAVAGENVQLTDKGNAVHGVVSRAEHRAQGLRQTGGGLGLDPVDAGLADGGEFEVAAVGELAVHTELDAQEVIAGSEVDAAEDRRGGDGGGGGAPKT